MLVGVKMARMNLGTILQEPVEYVELWNSSGLFLSLTALLPHRGHSLHFAGAYGHRKHYLIAPVWHWMVCTQISFLSKGDKKI